MLMFSGLFLAVLPLLLFTVLLLFAKFSLLKSSLAALFLTLILNFFYWQTVPVYFAVSLAKGALVALDIFLIIFGALFFLEILQAHKIIDHVSHYLGSISQDFRIQVILLAWFLENFIEGTAGFGTPTAIATPILVTIGFSPLHAVVLSLLGNSTSVVFGAAGTPIRVGFNTLAGPSLPVFAALLNLVGFLVPVFMLHFVTSSRPHGRKEFWEALPFAVISGLSFALASVVFIPLGQEFPSILGSILGLLFILAVIRLRIFLPPTVILQEKAAFTPFHSIRKVVSPYVLLIALLIVGKFLLSGQGFPISLFSQEAHFFNFYNPGLIFLVSAVPFGLIWLGAGKVGQSLVFSFKNALGPFLTIAAMSAVVQLMIFSGHNSSGLPDSLSMIAKTFTDQHLPLVAPFLGAFGSFITGSATISNIMFGSILHASAQAFNYSSDFILALALVGASAGNMIALADMLTAQAVVKLSHQETKILRHVILPCLVYVLLVGIIGWFLASGVK